MQAELSNNQPLLDIEILGVNWVGLESANAEATQNKSIPWLQDVDSDGDGASDAWADWGAEHLDLIMRDAHNGPLGFINLISTSLNEPENYDSLRDYLIDAAMESQRPWHNAENPLDINQDGLVIPQDVLIVVNRLNSLGVQKLPPPGVQAPQLFYDSNGDGDSTPLDALLVINFLNGQTDSGSAEGESLSAMQLSDRSLVLLQPSPITTVPSLNCAPPSTPDSNSKSPNEDWHDTVRIPKHDLARTINVDQVLQVETMDWLSELGHRDPAKIYPLEDRALQEVGVIPD